MKNFIKTLMFLSIAILTAHQAFAQAKDGEATVIQGSTTTVSISNAYQNTLNYYATGISYTWTASSSAITIQSKTKTSCTIKGNTAGTARLNYHCSYFIDGYYRTMDFYYDITIKSNIVSVTRVDMSPSSATLDIGETIQLSATAYPTNATNRTLNWTTENYSVASVSSNGLVTARGEGKVWIWARATDGSGAGNYCVITVNAPTKVSSIKLSQSNATMEIGETLSLTANVYPDNAYNKSLSWTSSNTDIATVSNGVVSAISSGECDIKCSSTDGSNVSASCHIIVNERELCWVNVVLPNGTFAINATDMASVDIKITPDEGFKLHSLTVDGEEQEVITGENLIALPPLSKSVTLNAVFEADTSSTIEEVVAPLSQVHLSVSGNNVNIRGTQPGTIANVYNMNGELIFTTNNDHFTITTSGVYILRIGAQSFKIAI